MSLYFGTIPLELILGISSAVISVISMIIAIVAVCKLKKVTRKYTDFMRGKDAESMEDQILKYFDRVQLVEENEKNIRHDIREIQTTLKTTYQKTALVKYDAFREMSGALSYSLALLDQENNGVLISSMYSREGCYTYAKEVKNGVCDINLSEEEEKALKQAVEK